MQSSFRVPTPTPRPISVLASTPGDGVISRRLLLAGAAAVTLLLAAASWWFSQRLAETGTTVGRFGVALPAPWLAYATSPATRPYLGDPVWTGRFEGRDCVAFEFYLACHDPREVVRGTLDEFDLVDLGRRTLPGGLAPKAAQPDAVVQAYIDRLERAGVAWRYWLGAPVSDAFCIAGAPGGRGECVQFYSRMQLRWDLDAAPVDPTAVRLTPLGHQVPRPR